MSIGRRNPAWLLLGSAAACLIPVSGAVAEDHAATAAPSNGVEEIIVTAQKRAERVQDVPISIVAVTGEALERSGVTSAEGLQRLAPGLTISAIGSGFASYTYIRGAGTNQVDAGSDPSVAYFVDEVYIGGKAGLQFDLFDIDRMEVLKGPQGTLFGRNAAAGAISIITKSPSAELGASLTAEGGNFDYAAARGSVTGPLNADGSLRFRLSAGFKRRDGVTENLAAGKKDPARIDEVGGRAQLEWAGHGGRVLLTAERLSARNGQNNQFLSSASSAGVLNSAAAASLPPGESFFKHYYDVSGYVRQDLTALTGRIELDTPLGQIVSLSAYRRNHFKILQDNDATIKNSNTLYSQEKDRTFSQELRLVSDIAGRIHSILGIYFYNARSYQIFELTSGPDHPINGPPFFLPSVTGRDIGTIRTKSYAAFGQVTVDITDQLSLIGGARYTEDHKSDDRSVKGLFAPAAFLANPHASWKSLDPAVTLNFKPSRDLLAYLSYREGFKSGGFQTLLPGSVAIANTPFKPEQTASWEVGIKSAWMDNRLIVNAALFRMRIINQQILRFISPPLPLQQIQNAGRTTTKGIDFSVEARPVSPLTLHANLTYQHARYDRYSDGTTDYAGKSQVRSPDFTMDIAARYAVSLGRGNLALSGDYFHSSKVFYDPGNVPLRGLFQPGYGVGNAQLTYAAPSGRWDVSAWVRNVGNTHYARNITVSAVTALLTPGDPRTFGLSLHVDF